MPVASGVIIKRGETVYILTRKYVFYIRILKALKNLFDLNLKKNSRMDPINYF